MYWTHRLWKAHKTKGMILGLFIIVITVLRYEQTNMASIITVLPLAFVFMLYGSIIARVIKKTMRPVVPFIVSLSLFIFFLMINYIYGTKSVDMSSMTLGIWPLYLLCGISGSMMIIFLSQFIKHLYFVSTIGLNSIYYYGLHYLILGIVSKIIKGFVAAIITLAILYPTINLYEAVKKRIIRKADV